MDAFIVALNEALMKAPLIDMAMFSFVTSTMANWVIPKRLMTGPIPHSKAMMDDILADGINTFVCLQQEMSPSFYTSHISTNERPQTFHFPVEDRNVPSKTKFIKDITKILQLLSEGRNIYIHCYGGHGRTGLYVCAILGCIYRELRNVNDAIYFFQSVHNMRKKQPNSFIGILPARVADSDLQRRFLEDFFALLSFCDNT